MYMLIKCYTTLISALHHNNCMYLAHHLLTLGHQYRARLPECLNQGAAKFVETVPRLRQLGTECLMQMMVKQRDQLEESLMSANGKTLFASTPS